MEESKMQSQEPTWQRDRKDKEGSKQLQLKFTHGTKVLLITNFHLKVLLLSSNL